VIARLRHTDEVLRLATTDGLTGLLNRRALEERLHRELQANGRRRSVALMMIDLDDFGAINNRYGHQIGDEALRLVADVVRTHLRRSDAGGRYGGDEFVVILPGLDATGAVEIAERVRTALVEATTRAADDGTLPRINTSIGVAAFPDDATSPGALIKAADEALYLSKRLGKNCVSLRSVA
jgi:diguanylate cyclase (GGDEF)-like protein